MRILQNNLQVEELDEPEEITLRTKCPEKWAAVDMETGDIWVREDDDWKRATKEQTKLVERLARIAQ